MSATDRPVEEPASTAARRWMLIGGAVAAVLVVLGAVASGSVLLSDYDKGAEPFCISDELVAQVQDEVKALVPAGASEVSTRVWDCDDNRTVSATFADPAVDGTALAAAVIAHGWVATSTPGCLEKPLDSRAFHLVIDQATGEGSGSALHSLEVTPGPCATT